MTSLHALAALFAAYMLFRHLPGTLALLRRREGPRPAMALVSAANVILALAILAFAVKGLVGGLISRGASAP